MEPLVSIIMPVYNCQKFIRNTLLSVFEQTCQDFEIVIVDDFSNDNTVEIIQSIDDPRIKLFLNDANMGAAYSRNKAISNAKGRFVAFLDGDDLWHKNKIDNQVKFMENNALDFTYTFYELIDENGQERNTIVKGPKIVTFNRFLKINYVGCLTAMYRRTLLPPYIPIDIYKRNDYAMWLILSQYSDCILLEESLAFYRKRPGSISSNNKFELLKYHYRIFRKVLNYNRFMSFYFTLVNIFYYLIKRIKYIRKIK